MNKNEYLYILRKNIQSLADEEIDEIIDDVASHFEFGQAEGKSEEDVAKELGDPELMARQFVPNSRNNYQQQSEPVYIPTTASKVLKFIVYGFIAMIALPMIFAVYAVFASLIFAGGMLIIGGIIALFSPILTSIIPGVLTNTLTFGATVVVGIGIILIGIAFIWIFVVLLRLFHHSIKGLYNRMFGIGDGAFL